jgi:hypothetical protein
MFYRCWLPPGAVVLGLTVFFGNGASVARAEFPPLPMPMFPGLAGVKPQVLPINSDGTFSFTVGLGGPSAGGGSGGFGSSLPGSGSMANFGSGFQGKAAGGAGQGGMQPGAHPATFHHHHFGHHGFKGGIPSLGGMTRRR